MKKINEDYINELLEKLTLDEKIEMIHAGGLFRTNAVERLDIPPVVTSDGPMGVRKEFDNDKWIFVGNTDDYVSYLPCNSALSSTWNRKLAKESGKVLGREARGRGKDVILAPGVNIKRVALCGRNFEYMSEDPYLNGELAVQIIKGIQEEDVAACVKHFAVNNQETERYSVDTVVDERSLNEIYFPAFKKAIDEGESYTIMGAYNKIFGEQCCESKYLLNEVLRKRWKYDGVIISDWGGVHDPYEAVTSSLDMEMSIHDKYNEYCMADPLRKLIKDKKVDPSLVDEKVRNILRLMLRLKMIGDEKDTRKKGDYNSFENREIIYKAAKESIVMLKNEDDVLPIKLKDKNGKKVNKVAVIGQNATVLHANAGGSAEIKALYEITPLMGIKTLLGGNTKVEYAKGYYIPKDMITKEVNWQELSLMSQDELDKMGEDFINGRIKKEKDSQENIKKMQEKLSKEAIKLAKESDVVIFVGGLDHNFDVEGKDREDMKLPYGQDELIKELLKVKPDMTVVMFAGSAVDMSDWAYDVKGLLWTYYAGMEGGRALADVLFGNVCPSAKLTETFVKKLEDYYPIKLNEFGDEKKVEYKDGVFVGYRYFNTYNVEPLFPFGYGLSYTSFDISKAQVSKDDTNETIKIKVSVTNTGKYDGAEVIQIYTGAINPTIKRPNKELKNFEKVFLKVNETKEVEFVLDKKDFSYFSEEKMEFVTDSGEYNIYIATSVQDIKEAVKVSF